MGLRLSFEISSFVLVSSTPSLGWWVQGRHCIWLGALLSWMGTRLWHGGECRMRCRQCFPNDKFVKPRQVSTSALTKAGGKFVASLLPKFELAGVRSRFFQIKGPNFKPSASETLQCFSLRRKRDPTSTFNLSNVKRFLNDVFSLPMSSFFLFLCLSLEKVDDTNLN